MGHITSVCVHCTSSASTGTSPSPQCTACCHHQQPHRCCEGSARCAASAAPDTDTRSGHPEPPPSGTQELVGGASGRLLCDCRCMYVSLGLIVVADCIIHLSVLLFLWIWIDSCNGITFCSIPKLRCLPLTPSPRPPCTSLCSPSRRKW